jgi:hypothetical protein
VVIYFQKGTSGSTVLALNFWTTLVDKEQNNNIYRLRIQQYPRTIIKELNIWLLVRVSAMYSVRWFERYIFDTLALQARTPVAQAT